MTVPAPTPAPGQTTISLAARAGEVLFILAIFFIHGAWPVPDVNEPHYLPKAKHAWDAEYLAHDPFLDSPNAHRTFNATTGWLTKYVSLEAYAWIGRITCWMLLAIAWHRLSFVLIPRWGASILTAALMVALNERAHMAGEWIVGGFEAKGLAYVLLLVALERWVVGSWNFALATMGAAAAFHVLVGGWGLICLGFAWLTDRNRPRLLSLLPGVATAGIVSLAGVLPGLKLSSGMDDETIYRANVIYVYYRLRHHLLPDGFRPLFIVRHVLLITGWGLLNWGRFGQVETMRRMSRFVWGAVAIAAIGSVLAVALAPWQEVAASLLRYYWFRLCDVAVPCGVSLALIWHLARRTEEPGSLFPPSWRTPLLLLCGGCALIHLGDLIYTRLERPAPRSEWQLRSAADWQDVCRAAAQETPADARFLVPRLGQTFRWHAQRSDVVNWKDIPQDAKSVVEWWDRLTDIYGWDDRPRPHSLAERGTAAVQKLAIKYQADYLITRAEPRLDFPIAYENRTYVLYRIPPITESEPKNESTSQE